MTSSEAAICYISRHGARIQRWHEAKGDRSGDPFGPCLVRVRTSKHNTQRNRTTSPSRVWINKKLSLEEPEHRSAELGLAWK